jgi:hypothetical protein
MVGPRWNMEAEREDFSLGAFKTYDNLLEGKNQMIPIQ